MFGLFCFRGECGGSPRKGETLQSSGGVQLGCSRYTFLQRGGPSLPLSKGEWAGKVIPGICGENVPEEIFMETAASPPVCCKLFS